MEFVLNNDRADRYGGDCLILGLFEGDGLSEAGAQLDQASGGHLEKLARSDDLPRRVGEHLWLHGLEGAGAGRVLIVGCGAAEKFSADQFRNVNVLAMRMAAESPARRVGNWLAQLPVRDHDRRWAIRQSALLVAEACYRYSTTLNNNESRPREIDELTVVGDKGDEDALQLGAAMGAGADLARELGNLPPNICTPAYLAEQMREVAKRHGNIKVKVLDRKDMEKAGMGALLSVAAGSTTEPRLIAAEYRGAGDDEAPIAFVGKGVTFDTGGISLKPGAAMDEMKFDMCGAASVIGALEACARLELPVNLLAVVPATDNMPDGSATHPGDIVTSLSGQTVEVLNTDAEGRLILCDALTWCEQYKPQTVIDVATLTGACIVALGKHTSGLMANDQELADEVLEAGTQAGDRAWQLPLFDVYQDQLKSPFADMANVGGKEAGTITAACFLSRYTSKFRWAHLDIAGTAWRSNQDKGATGRPVPLLVQFLANRAAG